jgi:hypothetical protein
VRSISRDAEGNYAIEDLCAVWPSLVRDSIEKSFFLSELDDIVVGADLGRDDLSEFILMTIRAKDGEEYSAWLRLPENILAPAFSSMSRNLAAVFRSSAGSTSRSALKRDHLFSSL